MKSRTRTLICGMTLFAAMAISVQLSAQGQQKGLNSALSPQITTFSAPHAGKGYQQGTFPLDNNVSGTITGYYQDARNVYHGFVRTADGTLTPFDPPGAGKKAYQGTFAPGINDAGVIVGLYQDAKNVYHGFIRTPDGTFTTIDAPDAGTEAFQGTFAENINDAGTISGFYEDWNYVYHGFVLTAGGPLAAGAFTTFDAPGAGTGFLQGTQVIYTGMNAGGAITGYSFDNFGAVPNGFLRTPEGDMLPLFDINGSLASFGESITTDETTTGYFLDKDLVYLGFLRDREGVFTVFGAPSVGSSPYQGTFVSAINPAHSITGAYIDWNNAYHGFVRSADGDFTIFNVPGATGINPQAINAAGAIAGYFYDQNYVARGFLYTP